MNKQITYLAIVILLFGCGKTKDDSKEESADNVKELAPDFEFYGNYIPTSEFKIKDKLLKGIEISTRDSLKGNKIDLIYIRFRNPETDDYYVVTNTKFEGTKDKFFISAKDSIIGEIQISGSFFGKLGPMKDNIKDPSTIVFKGTILADGIKNQKIECTYFEGD